MSRIDEQRLLERRFADQEVLHPRDHLVAGTEHLHDLEGLCVPKIGFG